MQLVTVRVSQRNSNTEFGVLERWHSLIAVPDVQGHACKIVQTTCVRDKQNIYIH